ncbi:TlyA family RNA methyltransferase [Desulfovibrio sulfodismutans]|uniref:TlyA family RNA methyltransferase n=1 Tax=Desulfolutivibrio sulfodismutans TaxID=63561 RepID=A0A7K3NL93_9BACT|nr:TlyA family RNA methyltransferase [Desulfolutivibrio sulfodismutans]NDY56964.1 TlyA family RNA methyltransferase [Desulfolutivibrio sulfodismutans]QLA11348.1 TlyA family rRNA (cytidine-2'-O)-methyltransferase [Desulfolutivibrio sulfodismutans DSM 3696]
MAKRKERVDQWLVEQGVCDSRERAKRLVMAGMVYVVAGEKRERVDKPGRQFGEDVVFEVSGGERFVGRGGYKLLTAIEAFGIEVAGKVGMDAGASTGGFTDCLLQHGAARVYAADVGHSQLHEKLRGDARVVVLEGVNLRHAGPDLLPEAVDILVLDVSFISLTLVLPPCLAFVRPGGEVVALVKPQFELGPERTDKGVVRREEDQAEAVARVTDFARQECGLELVGVTPSKIKGPKGNQEYLAYFKKSLETA